MKTKIETVAIIGLGALGINFTQCLRMNMKKETIRIVADTKRIQRYKSEGVYYNDTLCDFNYIDSKEEMTPADLVIFCTKFGGLADAMIEMKHQIGPETLIMSAINGISSEQVLSTMYKKENIIYTVAQGMDATKVANNVTCQHIGGLCFGVSAFIEAVKVECVAKFFTSVKFPYRIVENILQHQWSKFMFNVGLNQVIAIHKASYELIQSPGVALDEMIGAMREVMQLSNHANIHLNESHLQSWLTMSKKLSPQGKPSMAQDVDAKRYSEVELFAGTVLNLAKKYGIQTPINQRLYLEIQALEATYEKH